jgi:nucleoside 2-deoxyribosyltransferase
MSHQRVIRCVLSGSFHKDRPKLLSIYDELITCGCQVLSPHRLDFNSNFENTLFVRDSAEEDLSEEVIEKHHLTSIKQSDFLWVYAPEGYIGLSTAFEVGYAIANNVPVFSDTKINESVFSSFIHITTSVYKCLEYLISKD